MKRPVQPFGNEVVQLRPIAEADLGMTMDWRNRDGVRTWFKNSEIITRDRHRAWFAQYSARDDDFLFVVEARGRPVGQASVYGIDLEAGTAEVGRFLVAPEAAGRGYIGLACAELLRFCADTLNLRSVFLEVKEDNERAIGIYERNGFREEARADGMIRMSRSLDKEPAGSAYAGEIANSGR
jgi:RimJ/RimL family protein N-acetyltransferase